MHLVRNPFPETGDCTGMKVIGYGNLERGDDAAGALVAQQLREWRSTRA
jgi:Ni,Fe-hydrogenase maturation factor